MALRQKKKPEDTLKSESFYIYVSRVVGGNSFSRKLCEQKSGNENLSTFHAQHFQVPVQRLKPESIGLERSGHKTTLEEKAINCIQYCK